uniref:E2 ubiquitin-conjugating enzyme n=1 Tax=Panagrolaimus davidi TaxID=227884 RepID=A0A914PAS4_9BILA
MSSLQRLNKDFEEMQKNPPPLCTAGPTDDDIYQWEAIIIGPPETPYQGGHFKLKITFPKDYPFKPPNVIFNTQIFHPNISKNGSTCLDILKHEWKVLYGISQVLLAVTGLLDDPNPDSCLNSEAGNLYKNNREAFNKKASEMTKKYAVIN